MSTPLLTAAQSPEAESAQGVAQVTVTPDPTIVALEKEKAFLEVAKLEKETDWWWVNFVSLVTAIGAVGVGAFGVWRFFQERAADREKRADERQKHTDEFFQNTAEGLEGDHPAVMAATQALYTFLQPGYEKYYNRVFALAFFQLRGLGYDPEDENLKFRQSALGHLFCEAARARNGNEQPYLTRSITLKDGRTEQYRKRNFDAVGIQLQGLELEDVALDYVDLRHAKLQNTTLNFSSLKEVDLSWAQMGGAKLRRADLSGAIFNETVLAGVDFTGADLSGARFNDVDLRDANPEAAASLKDAVFTNVRNLTAYQRKECTEKGARFE
ncbi:MAG: pentapeptide repeat-containing protein [Chloroflexota bacterium]|nr:pentapeptide repeat-containing protein [Chloroflexota bacterium]